LHGPLRPNAPLWRLIDVAAAIVEHKDHRLSAVELGKQRRIPFVTQPDSKV
jgi:hypothetical protein